jgi:WD40 repeat protein
VPEGALELWSVAKGELEARLPTRAAIVYGLAFSPDGSTLAAGGVAQASVGSATTGSLELWSVLTDKLLNSAPLLSGSKSVSSVYYSTNGKTLYALVTGATQEVQVFDALTNQRLGYVPTGEALSYALSPINGLFASAATGVSVARLPVKF